MHRFEKLDETSKIETTYCKAKEDVKLFEATVTRSVSQTLRCSRLSIKNGCW
jgi:ribosomal protein L17